MHALLLRRNKSGLSGWGSFRAAEVVLLAFVLVTYGAYSILEIPLRQPFELYFERFCGALAWYGTALLTVFFLLRIPNLKQGRSWVDTICSYREMFLNKSAILEDLRLLNLFSVFFTVFLHLKHLTPHINSKLYDDTFRKIDFFICGGEICSQKLIQFLGLQLAEIVSEFYLFFYPYLGLLLSVMVLQRERRLAWEFAFGFMTVWLLGVVLVYLLPSFGPCFYYPQSVSALPLTSVVLMQQELWSMKAFVEANPGSELGAFLISGFPSLHVAAVFLGSLYLWRVNSYLSVCSWLFAILTLISTIYLGWHYVIDNLGGIVLACLVYRASVLIFRRSNVG